MFMKNPFAFPPSCSLNRLRRSAVSVLLGVLVFVGVPLRADAGPGYGPVTWQDAVNLTVSGASVTKNGGCDGCPDAYAVSGSQSAAQDTYLQFPVVMGKQVLVGLVPDGAAVSSGGLSYSVMFRTVGAPLGK